MLQWRSILVQVWLVALCTFKNGSCATYAAYFEAATPATNCSVNTTSVVITAASKTECAMRSSLSDIWRSFSFINGVCVLSTVSNCTPSGMSNIFVKRQQEGCKISCPTPPSEVVNVSPSGYNATIGYNGYNDTVGSRLFWVFQQRKAGLVSFVRNWTDYERGFGDANDFWSGLIALKSLAPRTLRIEAVTFDGVFYVAEWTGFTVADANSSYTMNYGSYSSGSSNVSGDTLANHKGMKFSTIDKDNDQSATTSCSQSHGSGGFWFNACMDSNPNGLYSSTNQSANRSFVCSSRIVSYKTLRQIRMMLQI